jgi:hypothetical protein
MTTAKNRLQELETKLSVIFGVNVEITIRSEKAFTITFDGENELAAKRISSYLAAGSQVTEYGYDPGSEATFIYFSAN